MGVGEEEWVGLVHFPDLRLQCGNTFSIIEA